MAVRRARSKKAAPVSRSKTPKPKPKPRKRKPRKRKPRIPGERKIQQRRADGQFGRADVVRSEPAPRGKYQRGNEFRTRYAVKIHAFKSLSEESIRDTIRSLYVIAGHTEEQLGHVIKGYNYRLSGTATVAGDEDEKATRQARDIYGTFNDSATDSEAECSSLTVALLNDEFENVGLEGVAGPRYTVYKMAVTEIAITAVWKKRDIRGEYDFT
jgi:hypothetical protein